MTFIASVIAKKGVAVIADSLVTSMERVIDYDSFLKFFKTKAKSTPIDEIKIEPSELISLFERKPSHTKDYEEKLFQYDKYTAVTTAGTASVNKKRIEYLVKEIIDKNKKDKSYSRKKFETKVREFADFLNKQVIEHLNKTDYISATTFIFTHYDKGKEQTNIYKVDITPCSKKDIKDDKFNCVSVRKMEDYYRVVCDGQNRISERILFGEIDFFIDITPKIIEKVVEKLKIPADKVSPDFVKDFIADAKSFLPPQFYEDMKINRLVDLSLQQAVDLASLLMKIEINFQKYTENIPTVGGVIKLAIIDKEGFKFISGHEILKTENLN
jgi:20S proteasome alpha/beta subunit